MTGKNHQFTTGWLLLASAVLTTVAVMFARAPMRGASDETLVGKPLAPIQVSADWSQEWQEEHGTVALFRGLCQIVQGSCTYSADSMVIWAHVSDETPGQVERMTVYLEGDVRIDDAGSSRTDQSHWVELDASRGITLTVRGRVADRSGRDDPLFKRALQRRSGPSRGKLRQTQMTVPSTGPADPGWQAVPMQTPVGMRQIRVSPRSFNSPYNISSQLSTDTTPPEQVTLITGGVNILVEGVSLQGGVDFGVIDLSADRVVIWTDDFSENQQQLPDQKYQVYLEGNIVIRQRDNVRQLTNKILAERAYYDARDHRALILDAELETYISQLDTSVRLRADRIRQNSEKNFHAQNAWITTSQYGVPGYRVQASATSSSKIARRGCFPTMLRRESIHERAPSSRRTITGSRRSIRNSWSTNSRCSTRRRFLCLRKTSVRTVHRSRGEASASIESSAFRLTPFSMPFRCWNHASRKIPISICRYRWMNTVIADRARDQRHLQRDGCQRKPVSGRVLGELRQRQRVRQSGFRSSRTESPQHQSGYF